jgi:hypothetical protein
MQDVAHRPCKPDWKVPILGTKLPKMGTRPSLAVIANPIGVFEPASEKREAGPGRRFRSPIDPGVFYGADEIRTACAELGYWRWRFLMDCPALEALDAKPQTVFRAQISTTAVDLRKPPFADAAVLWTHPTNYTHCQQFASVAREATVGAIRLGASKSRARCVASEIREWAIPPEGGIRAHALAVRSKMYHTRSGCASIAATQRRCMCP